MKRTEAKPRPVLVVDDDPDSLNFAVGVLEKEWLVLSATNGSDALKIARTKRPAVIVLDVMLSGGQDGFTVFRELGNDPATKGIPVIFLTSVNQRTGLPFAAADLKKYLGREPAAFLEKPISADQLLRQVDDVSRPGQAKRSCAAR